MGEGEDKDKNKDEVTGGDVDSDVGDGDTDEGEEHANGDACPSNDEETKVKVEGDEVREYRLFASYLPQPSDIRPQVSLRGYHRGEI